MTGPSLKGKKPLTVGIPLVRSRAAAVASRLQQEGGFTLIELLTSMVLLAIVMAGITTTLASATKSEADLAQRFRAQEAARLALTTVRADLHCATDVTPPSGGTSSVTLTIPSGCRTAAGSVTWCAVSSGGALYGLWRIPGTSCNTSAAGNRQWAQNLTSSAVFTPDASTHAGAAVLPSVRVMLSVSSAHGSYKASDTIYLRNGARQ